MATINLSVLEAALSDGKITGILSIAQKQYFHPSVVTANEILAIIKAWDKVDASQIAYRLKINKETIFQYTRWLQEAKLIAILPNRKDAADGRSICNIYVPQQG